MQIPLCSYFNPRSHERSDAIAVLMDDETRISIHAPTRGATQIALRRFSLAYYFNPRSHERSDRAFILCSLSSVISIHAPTRGATKSQVLKVMRFGFQSTLPREERLCTDCGTNKIVISIHAPTRGATFSTAECRNQFTLFQSTLPREERLLHPSCVRKAHNFNPRSHERSDDNFIRYRFIIVYFNPRSHERSDSRYQPRCSSSRNFNPRSHERSDLLMPKLWHKKRISIHAPTRGATMSVAWYQGYNSISIHAPTRGATIVLTARPT